MWNSHPWKDMHKRDLKQWSLVGALISCASYIGSLFQLVGVCAQIQEQHGELIKYASLKLFARRIIGGCLRGSARIWNLIFICSSHQWSGPMYERGWYLLSFFSLCISKHFGRVGKKLLGHLCCGKIRWDISALPPRSSARVNSFPLLSLLLFGI